MIVDYLESIYKQGEDFFRNQFGIEFLKIPSLLSSDKDYSLLTSGIIFRISSVAITSSQIPTIDYKYRGMSVNVPFGIEETTQEVTFNIRLDRDLKFYKILEKWKNKICGRGSSVFSPNLQLFDSNFVIYRDINRREDKEPPGKMTFYSAYPKKIDFQDFSYEEQTPTIAPVTMGFIYYEDSLVDG